MKDLGDRFTSGLAWSCPGSSKWSSSGKIDFAGWLDLSARRAHESIPASLHRRSSVAWIMAIMAPDHVRTSSTRAMTSSPTICHGRRMRLSSPAGSPTSARTCVHVHDRRRCVSVGGQTRQRTTGVSIPAHSACGSSSRTHRPASPTLSPSGTRRGCSRSCGRDRWSG